jgi:hypothetical protein
MTKPVEKKVPMPIPLVRAFCALVVAGRLFWVCAFEFASHLRAALRADLGD